MAKEEKEKPVDLIISIRGIQFDVKVNEDVYSKEDIEEINHLVKFISKEIWIDRTYVDFKGSRWENTWIVDSKWRELMELISGTNFGRDANEEQNDEITQCLIIMSATYVYQVLKTYGYDLDHIDLEFKPCDFYSKYVIDERDNFDM